MDFFAEFMKLVVRACVGIGGLIGSGIHALIMALARGTTTLPAPTKAQKKELDENQRLAGCREVVMNFINHLGFIARECMSREELEEKIDSGISPQELEWEIHSRIQKIPGIVLGTFGRNGYDIKQPMNMGFQEQ